MAMKKFINDPNNLTPELLDGLCTAFADKLSLVSEKLTAAGIEIPYVRRLEDASG